MDAKEFLESKGIYSLDTKKRTQEVYDWMEEYAKQKCIEQKEICSDAFSNIASPRTDPDYPREYRAIRNAPLATDK